MAAAGPGPVLAAAGLGALQWQRAVTAPSDVRLGEEWVVGRG